MKKFLMTVTMLTLTAVLAQADLAAPPTQVKPVSKEERREKREEMKEKHAKMLEETKAACAADIAATGCKEEPGKGLFKCIHAYKKEHKDFKLSETCIETRKEHKEERKEKKEQRAERKARKGAETAAAPETK